MSDSKVLASVPPDIEANAENLRKPAGDALTPLAGSGDLRFNNVLVNAVVKTLWLPGAMTEERRNDIMAAALAGLRAFNPRNEVEAMMAAQAVAMHHAAMECARRAMLPDQPDDAADRLRRQAVSMSRAMVDMAEAIERRRGKGPQVVRVERVVVHDGGQAIVGTVGPSSKSAMRGDGSNAG